MAYKGSIGTSMGSIINIKKPLVINPDQIHCDNCKFFIKAICQKLNENTEGKIKRLSNKNDAKKCSYFTIKLNDTRKSKRSNQKKTLRNTKEKNKLPTTSELLMQQRIYNGLNTY